MRYRIPDALRGSIRGRRVAIVNDVINAGSAVRGTFADLLACGAVPIALSALVVLGESAMTFAEGKDIPLLRVAHVENRVWTPRECPLCSAHIPLNRGGHAR
ncbi:MAG: hypothetical protein ACR2JC_16195 [Chloroflexota bacterium]|nr:MAG: hypothetical protein DLM70_12960 [Chloroflexota bacterium]